jgi:hypothetical protein
VNAKERMILTNFPFLSKEEVKKIITDNTIFHEKRKPDKYTIDFNKDSKENRINYLKSNIFNNPTKTEFNRNVKLNLSREVEVKEITNSNHRSSSVPHKNKWNANLDWKVNNTEIIFKKENDDKETDK